MVANPFRRRVADANVDTTPTGAESPGSDIHDSKAAAGEIDDSKITFLRGRIFAMAMIVSLGGCIFGYDTGQISGFIAMPNFLFNFARDKGPGPDNYRYFPNWQEGTIVGLLSIGTLFGSLGSGPIADKFGRRLAIVVFNIIFIIGVLIQITTFQAWYQVAIGRWVAGIGVGGLSVMVPMYQSETAPKQIRGSLVSTYQLFITFGIFLADCINYGTSTRGGAVTRPSPTGTGTLVTQPGSASQWRIPMGIGFIFPVVMAIGIMFLRESPRWDYRNGNISRARQTIALSYGVPENHREVIREMREIQEKFDAEQIGGKHPWYEIFTGPRMAYRTILGMTLQSLQQLTGANFFFYYGTTVFQNIQTSGLSNGFVTAIILGVINFGSTFLGLYIVDRFGRRRSLIPGAVWMFICFMIFASIGHFVLQPNSPLNRDAVNPNTNLASTAALVMIVFTCLFIFGYAITWGPIVWALVGEIFPTRYRAKSMGFVTCANWTWNFLISFFTPYITSAIDYRYGYIFAACNFAAALIIYFFVPESQGRTLEEIDTMYILHVKAWKSTKWQPPAGEELGETDRAYLSAGARNIHKQSGVPDRDQVEKVPTLE